CRCGTLPSDTGPSASSVAARIGNAAFFAPEIGTSPSSGAPPWIASWSKASRRRAQRSFAALGPFFGREGLQRERVDLVADAWPERRVHELVALQAALAGERRGDDRRLVVALAVGFDARARASEVLFDQRCEVARVHAATVSVGARGPARSGC